VLISDARVRWPAIYWSVITALYSFDIVLHVVGDRDEHAHTGRIHALLGLSF
jgi:hypothetical protein